MRSTGHSQSLLLLLLVAASASADVPPEHGSLLRLPSSSARPLAPKFPRSAAADLIRALNLHPRDASPRHPGVDGAVPAGTLVERPLHLASLATAGDPSVVDLGHHAGYFRLPNTHDARMFYFFFESRRHKKDPVVIWLTGGPGCSSELALFYENGPFHIADNMSLVWNDFGWDQESNLIYVDQPTGTGFSYSSDSRDTRHNEASVSNDLYDFLQAFFAEHPKYAKNDFYITGESYAGHYIPAFASRVHQGNKNSEGIHINLKGFAIGNGLTDPAIQYKAYTDYALDMGLITQSQFNRINKIVPTCEFAIKLCGTSGTVSCLAAYFVCNAIFSSIRTIIGSKNYYDIRKPCVGSLCYDFSNMEKFLNLKSVRESLGIGDREFVSCSPTVYEAMLLDWMRNLEVGIPELLENDIKVLIYAGEYDLICNWLGNSRWVNSMEWSGKEAFVSSSEKPFTVDGKEAGVLKSYGPLSFLKVLRPVEVTNVLEDEILIIRFNEMLPLGEGTLVIAFQGTLNDKMKGFYRSVYELNGEKKNMAVTQFEPADARRCFPCWDEPSFKAVFKITLEVPYETVALSNMPVVEERVNGPTKTVYFQETPIMSTYLVAVIVGMFDYVEAFTTDGTRVRVYTQVGKSAQGKFALEVAVKTLVLFKEYFAVPYPLPKMDMIAIPDFAIGAMENYGLVTYRETALLFDERHSAAANKQRVAVVVAHELAHQWFGNLVTMEWWTHLWLKEGFATWVSYLAADHFFPEWNVWTQFLEESTTGFKLDALAGSHPIEVDVNHVDEIDEIFDAISYRKGAAVIRMLQSYLGGENFQKSLAAYIKRFAYSNAKTEDLWAALEEGSGEPVKTLMHSWTKQQGYPVVNVKLKDGKLELEQMQFLSSGSTGVGQWTVPITLCFCSYSRQEKFLFHGKQEDFNLSGLLGCQKKDDFWIKLNASQTGFYRVSYDEELASRLRYAVETNKLSAADRYGVLDDTYALCMAGKQKLVSLLHLIAAYKDETEYTVLAHTITTSLSIVKMMAVAAPEELGNLKKFLIDFLEPFAQRLGWDAKSGEGHLNALLRGTLLTALAELGHEATINEAVRRFNVFLEDRETPLLPPDVRKAAYVALMQTVSESNKAGYESLLKIYRETDLSQEKVRVLGSLASSSDPCVVREALNFVLSPEVRNQDSIFVLRGVSAEAHEVAWAWLKENWDYISNTFSGTLLTYFVTITVSPLATDEKGDEAEEFFKSRTKANIARTVKQSIERVRISAKWVKSIRGEANLGNVLKELAQKH